MKQDPHRYDDMLDMPHHQSRVHPHMSASNRAAQFSPFAALTGYEAVVSETARFTEAKITLTDEEKSLLNEQLLQIAQNIARHPEVTLTCFVPDRRKSGGSYVCISNHVKKIDTYKRCLILSDENNRNENYEISFDNILEIKEIKDI